MYKKYLEIKNYNIKNFKRLIKRNCELSLPNHKTFKY